MNRSERGKVPSRRTLTVDEQKALGRRIREGDRAARDELILHNLRLVASLAAGYARTSRVPIDDLIGYGNVGLIRAVDRYDPERPNTFSTFACFWIHRSIREGIHEFRHEITIPHWLALEMQSARLVAAQLEQEQGPPAQLAEVGRRLGVTARRMMSFHHAYCVLGGWGPEARFTSLPEGGGPDRSPREPADPLDASQLARLHTALAQLDRRAALLLRERYGLGSLHGRRRRARSLTQAAARLGLTPEEAKHVEAVALEHLLEATHTPADCA